MDHQTGSPPPPEFNRLDPPSEAARTEARARHETLRKPTGSLGRLEELGAWLAACQGQSPPRPPERARVVVFAADHGIAARGVSADPPETTSLLADAVLDGGMATNVLADEAGAGVRLVDVGIDSDSAASHQKEFKIRRSSGAIDVEDALSAAETSTALRAGIDLADAEVDSGTDLLIPASIGVAGSTISAALIATLTDTEPVAVVGRGSGIDDAAWMRKVTAIRDARRRARAVHTDPVAVLRTAGGADLACLAGFLAQAAVRRTPVLLDGLTSAAAALVAQRLAPGARAWWTAAQRGPEPAHALALAELDLVPVLDLDISLEQGAAGSAALPLLRMSARVLTEMSTRDKAGRR